jgi:hypothetical protein
VALIISTIEKENVTAVTLLKPVLMKQRHMSGYRLGTRQLDSDNNLLSAIEEG